MKIFIYYVILALIFSLFKPIASKTFDEFSQTLSDDGKLNITNEIYGVISKEALDNLYEYEDDLEKAKILSLYADMGGKLGFVQDSFYGFSVFSICLFYFFTLIPLKFH